MRFEVQGIVDGEPRIVARARHPPRRRPRARVAATRRGTAATASIVTGNPSYTCDVQMMGDDGDHNTAGLVGTAGRLVNAIPAVCAADPGLLSVLDLPLITGKGLMR